MWNKNFYKLSIIVLAQLCQIIGIKQQIFIKIKSIFPKKHYKIKLIFINKNKQIRNQLSHSFFLMYSGFEALFYFFLSQKYPFFLTSIWSII